MNQPLALTIAFLLTATSQAQTSWYVDVAATPPGTGSVQDPYSSLAFALEQTSTASGDTIFVAPGVYAESVDLLGKDVSILGDPSALPEFIGDGQSSVFRIASGESSACRLARLIIRGTAGTDIGGSTFGGGLFIDGAAPTLVDLRFTGCSAERGGAIAVLDGSPRLSSSQLTDNEASIGGAIHLSGGAMRVDSTSFTGNLAGTSPTLNQSGGGAIASDTGTSLFITDSEFELNRTSRGSGGALLCLGTGWIDSCTFEGNLTGDSTFTAGGGGGAAVSNLTQGFDCHFEDNGGMYTQNGGGASGGRWVNTTFRGNHCYFRGAGLSGAVAEDCWIVENVQETEGGAAGPGGGAAESSLLRCTIEGNVALGFEGAGTYNCDLTDCVVRSNRFAFFAETSGGGVFGGTALRCLIEDNRVSMGFGGGAAFADLIQCLILRNQAGGGGGTYRCDLDRCTVVQNFAFYGATPSDPAVGGVLNLFANPVRSSILWGNFGLDLGGPPAVTYSIVGGGAPGVGNLDLDPEFFGPGSDLHLTAASPGIDAGDPSAPLDMDGTRADMGALAFLPGWTRTDGPMCIGTFDLESVGSPSFSGPLAYLQAESPSLFLLGVDAQITPIPLFGASGLSFHCFSRGVRRLMPSSTGRLDLTPQLLGSLGLIPGDRIYVAAWNSQGQTSITWDLGVLP